MSLIRSKPLHVSRVSTPDILVACISCTYIRQKLARDDIEGDADTESFAFVNLTTCATGMSSLFIHD